MMTSRHVACLSHLLEEYFSRSQYGFSFDANLKKSNPLIQRRLAFSSDAFTRRCSVFLEVSKDGHEAGFNTFLAWGSGLDEVVHAVRARGDGAGETVAATQCVLMQQVWDPEHKDRSTYFGWHSIRVRRVSVKTLVKKAKEGLAIDVPERVMEEIAPALELFRSRFETYAIPFFKALDGNIGKQWADAVV